jgi:hypothetical protein
VPFHAERLRLGGMDEAHFQEAAAVAQAVVGFSAYLHGVGYSVEQFRRELDAAVQYIRSQSPQQPVV